MLLPDSRSRFFEIVDEVVPSATPLLSMPEASALLLSSCLISGSSADGCRLSDAAGNSCRNLQPSRLQRPKNLHSGVAFDGATTAAAAVEEEEDDEEEATTVAVADAVGNDTAADDEVGSPGWRNLQRGLTQRYCKQYRQGTSIAISAWR